MYRNNIYVYIHVHVQMIYIIYPQVPCFIDTFLPRSGGEGSPRPAVPREKKSKPNLNHDQECPSPFFGLVMFSGDPSRLVKIQKIQTRPPGQPLNRATPRTPNTLPQAPRGRGARHLPRKARTGHGHILILKKPPHLVPSNELGGGCSEVRFGTSYGTCDTESKHLAWARP